MRVLRPLILVALVLAGVVSVPPMARAAPESDPVQVLAFNDFHGRISRTTGTESRLVTSPGRDGVYGNADGGESDDVVTRVGGAAHMASLVHKRQAAFRREAGGSAASFFVGAGDLVGESPPESAAFSDEPTIEVLNEMGLDASVIGNHELGRGLPELFRISAATDGRYADDAPACQGVTPGVDGCFGQGEHVFTGAEFTYLAANVVSRRTGEPILPPYEVLFTARGTRLALIGVLRESTATSERPVGTENVLFLEEASAVNRLIPELRSQGIEAIGVLLHTGGQQSAEDPNGCEGLDGAVVDVNRRIDAAVDFLVTADTHDAYNCLLPVPRGEPRLVTQAGAYGQLVTDIRLTIDRRTGDVDRTAAYGATNVPVTRVAPDEAVESIVDYWVTGPGNRVDEGSGAPISESAVEGDGSGRATVGVVLLLSLALGGGTAAAWQWRRNRSRSRRSSDRYGRGMGVGHRHSAESFRRGGRPEGVGGRARG